MTGTLRRLLLGLVLLGIVGLLLELLLLEHTESTTQLVPFAALGAGVLVTIAAAARPNRTVVRLFRATMVLFVAVGVAGVLLHFRGNLAFEREMDATVGGLALVWLALRGATPALAPGAMVQLGLLGLLATYRHPALEGGRSTTHTPEVP